MAGQVPFVAESVTQLTAMVLTEVPRAVDNLRPEVPRELSRVVQRCLEKDPDRRFPSVAQLAAALEPFAPSDTRELAHRIARIASGAKLVTGASPPDRSSVRIAGGTSVSWSGRTQVGPRGGKRWAVVSALGTVAALALVGGLLLARRTAPQPAAGAASAAPAAATSTAASSGASMPPAAAVASDGVAAKTSSVASAATATPSATTSPPARPGGARPAAPTAHSLSNEPPRYRTSW
jgi:hypothetical protein